ncbi:hypothetical protein V2E24_00540 [Mycoplasmopsis ciconiae]|uniref:Uncharacterized protein n=1 Tax=Mycoplasmopsis ciconiae TaxID=561067 RepID=A0ABU7MKL2_9BACT|nr:hypothetical protein [Mycoplasmopsis ciconiae]
MKKKIVIPNPILRDEIVKYFKVVNFNSLYHYLEFKYSGYIRSFLAKEFLTSNKWVKNDTALITHEALDYLVKLSLDSKIQEIVQLDKYLIGKLKYYFYSLKSKNISRQNYFEDNLISSLKKSSNIQTYTLPTFKNHFINLNLEEKKFIKNFFNNNFEFYSTQKINDLVNSLIKI